MRLGRVTQTSPLLVQGNGDTVAVAADGPALAVGTEVGFETVEGRRQLVHVAPDIWHVLGGAGEPALLNSWAGYNSHLYGTPAFRRLSSGLVMLRGRVAAGAVGTAVFTLPAGLRPAYIEARAVAAAGNVYGQLTITAAGEVSVVSGSSTWTSLSCSFLAEQ